MAREPKPKYVALNRNQLRWLDVNLEESIGPEHPARVIWALLGGFDLSGFEEPIASHEGESGRPCWPPQLLISVWVYGYQQGVGSARALEKMMRYEPGLRWLCAADSINHHTLSDFRVSHRAALDDLLAQLLAVLEQEGLADFTTVMQDGTKIRSVAAKSSWQRRERVAEQLRRARQYVREVAAQSEEEGEQRRQAARRRAAREKRQRLEAALEEVRRREAEASSGNKPPRVSTTEAEARMMKQPDGGGWAPGYNLQLVTEPHNRFVGGVTVSTAANDQQQLEPGVAAVEQATGRRPRRVVADSGYATRDNVAWSAEKKIELVAPWPEEAGRRAGADKRQGRDPRFSAAQFTVLDEQTLQCPAGRRLEKRNERRHHGQPCAVYEAQASDCAGCDWRQACCAGREPRRVEKVIESAAMRRYLQRSDSESGRHWRQRRSEVAEFPFLWIKGLWGRRRFAVRGLAKVSQEAKWWALSYNFAQWQRLRGPTATPAAA